MKIEAYNTKTGQLLSGDVSGINFGDIIQGDKTKIPLLVRLKKDGEEVYNAEIFLQNNGGYNNTEFGYFINKDFVQVRSAGSTEEEMCDGCTEDYPCEGSTEECYYITEKFELNENPVKGEGITLYFYEESSDYLWLDAKPGLNEAGNSSRINFRFLI